MNKAQELAVLTGILGAIGTDTIGLSAPPWATRRTPRPVRANDGTTDEEKAAASKRERKRARWAEACAKREAKRRVV